MVFFCIFSPFFSILAAFLLISAHIKANYDTLMDFFNEKNYLEHESGAICTFSRLKLTSKRSHGTLTDLNISILMEIGDEIDS